MDLDFTSVPMSFSIRLVLAAVLAAGMSSRGLNNKSLSRSGAAAAFCVGLVHMGCGYTFGMVLIAFYLTSSKLTSLNQARKAACDASVRLGGQRGAIQVLSNSAGGCVAAATAFGASLWSSHPMAATVQLVAWAAFLGHYSCCCADTWASEIGMLSSSAPRLITTGRRVPTGTNGGVTLLGLAASAAGGLFMGLVVWAAGCVSRETRHPGVLQQHNSMHAQQWMLLATAAGVFGSLTDSLLGATVQYSGWCTKTHKVVPRAAQHVQHISGLPLLSNNAVNAVSALLTSLGVAVVVLLHARGAGVLS